MSRSSEKGRSQSRLKLDNFRVWRLAIETACLDFGEAGLMVLNGKPPSYRTPTQTDRVLISDQNVIIDDNEYATLLFTALGSETDATAMANIEANLEAMYSQRFDSPVHFDFELKDCFKRKVNLRDNTPKLIKFIIDSIDVGPMEL